MQRRRRRKKFRLHHFILILLIFWLTRTLIGQSMMMRELNSRKEEVEKEIAQLEEEIKELEKEIKNKDSLESIEKVARDELKLVKPREIIYIDKNKEKNIFKKPAD
ncbi:MAG: septum formation initiator family protein [Tissierellia bacterium]|nr:septum formation initiator family protein [Tissierellia bacterium]